MIELLDRLFIFLFFLFASVFLVLISILSPITIDDHEELGVAMFGYPIPFAQQDLMRDYGDYEGGYPRQFTIGTDSIHIHQLPFLLSVIIVYIGLLIIRYLHNRFLL